MRYLDTSIVVSALTAESTTAVAIDWLRTQAKNPLASSAWMATEFSASLSRKIRMSRLTLAERGQAIMRFNTAILPTLAMLQVDADVFRRASEIAGNHLAGIRSGDALHLAIASGHGHVLCTFDKAFAAGATRLGYSVELIA